VRPAIHKRNGSPTPPDVSIILLDWSVRESFHALNWLSMQDVPRATYELIWLDLYDRVVPEAMEKADIVITCRQKGMYHKHMGYNIGLLHSRGRIITVCDSDAVFPPNFVSSIVSTLNCNDSGGPSPLVLMHYEWRTSEKYPPNLSSIAELSNYSWQELWPNVGACMSVRRKDALRFGGFDEHRSFKGYLCGPYDLGWRLINAGIPEIWHDESTALWHFAHPDPVASFRQQLSLEMAREIMYPHLEGHALTAVEAFSSGRILPLLENPEIRKLRLAQRRVGTDLEERYANIEMQDSFTKFQRFKLLLASFFETYNRWIVRKARCLMTHEQRRTLESWWLSTKAKVDCLIRDSAKG
jgi:hypothetical protein